MKFVGIGDSNLTINGGWAYGFEKALAHQTLLSAPGQTSRYMRSVLGGMSHDKIREIVDPDDIVLITTGINDVLQGVGPIEFVRNHIAMMKRLRRVWPGVTIWLMPSHPGMGWKLEVMRFALWLYVWLDEPHGVKFVNLRKWRSLLFYKGGHDRYHLTRYSYTQIAEVLVP